MKKFYIDLTDRPVWFVALGAFVSWVTMLLFVSNITQLFVDGYSIITVVNICIGIINLFWPYSFYRSFQHMNVFKSIYEMNKRAFLWLQGGFGKLAIWLTLPLYGLVFSLTANLIVRGGNEIDIVFFSFTLMIFCAGMVMNAVWFRWVIHRSMNTDSFIFCDKDYQFLLKSECVVSDDFETIYLPNKMRVLEKTDYKPSFDNGYVFHDTLFNDYYVIEEIKDENVFIIYTGTFIEEKDVEIRNEFLEKKS